MTISITEDIRPITDLKRHSREILDQIHETQRPIVLTVNGRTAAVMMDPEVFEKRQQAFETLSKLNEAESDISAGKTRSAKTFFKEFKRGKKISG